MRRNEGSKIWHGTLGWVGRSQEIHPKAFPADTYLTNLFIFQVQLVAWILVRTKFLYLKGFLEPISFPPTHKLQPRFYKCTSARFIYTFWASRGSGVAPTQPGLC